MLDASDHKIDDRLRRIDDAMRIGDLYGKALKEFFIDDVNKTLLLRPIADRLGFVFERDIKMIERLEEIGFVKTSGRERIDHFFDLGGDHIPPDEIGIIEYARKEPCGQ
jgi:hypothetical protein